MANSFIIVGVVILAEALLKLFPAYRPGLLTTFVDIALLVWAMVALRNFQHHLFAKAGKIALLAFLVGDFTYSSANYFLKLGTPNTYWCLVYIIPYLFGMAVLVMLGGRSWSVFDRQQRFIGLSLLVTLFIGSSIGIIIPAVFDKKPALPFILSILTVVYSALESMVLGLYLMLAAFSLSMCVQRVAMGIAVMHASDLALRYQSLRPESMGFSIFEWGWILGLTLIVSGLRMLGKEHRDRGGISLRTAGSKSIQATMVKTLFLRRLVSFWLFVIIYGVPARKVGTKYLRLPLI